MTKVVLPEAKIFRELIDTIGNFADEVSINLGSDELTIKAMDVDQTSLIDLHLPRDLFLEYEVGEPVTIGVSVSNLKKALRHLKKGETLAIEPEGDYVKFTIGAGGIVSRIYKYRNLEVPVPEVPELELKHTVTAKLMAQAVKKVIEDIESVGGNTEISASENAVVFKSVGVGRVEVRFTTGSLALISLEVTEPAQSVYDTTKLVNILGIARVSDIVEFHFASKMPLRADFAIGQGKLTYILAPLEV